MTKQEQILKQVIEWSETSTTRYLKFIDHDKAEAVKSANLLRQEGFVCKVEDQHELYSVTVERKAN